MTLKPAGGKTWKAGWHYTCDDCSADSSDAGTQGYGTQREAQAALHAHRRSEHRPSKGQSADGGA